jgi:hypothetical protein
MKKLLTLAIICIFSIVLINCSSGSESTPKSAANTNSATTTKPVAQPTAANKGKSDADKADDGKSDADKMDDGKSDADKSNSNK